MIKEYAEAKIVLEKINRWRRCDTKHPIFAIEELAPPGHYFPYKYPRDVKTVIQTGHYFPYKYPRDVKTVIQNEFFVEETNENWMDHWYYIDGKKVHACDTKAMLSRPLINLYINTKKTAIRNGKYCIPSPDVYWEPSSKWADILEINCIIK